MRTNLFVNVDVNLTVHDFGLPITYDEELEVIATTYLKEWIGFTETHYSLCITRK